MNSQEVDEYLPQSVLDNPDGYFGLNALQRQAFIRQKLRMEVGRQFRSLQSLSNPLEQRVSRAALSLVIPFTQLLIAFHDERNYGKSWRDIDLDLSKQLKSRLNTLIHEFHSYPLYTQTFQLILEAIDSQTIESHSSISKQLRLLAVEMSKQGIPILLVTLDNYLGPTLSEPLTYNQLEPDIKVLRNSQEHAALIQLVKKELERLGKKATDEEVVIIIGEILIAGGWMIASKSSGDNLLEHVSVMIPEFYKYTSICLHLAQKFGIHMTKEDVVRCMLRLHSAHEQAHGLHGDKEFEADRVAIPTALSLALRSGDEEYKKQVIFVIADMCGNMKPYDVFSKTYHRPKNYEQGYITSGIFAFDAFTHEQVLQINKKNEWEIHPEHHTKSVMHVLKQEPSTTLRKAEHVTKRNKKIKKLYRFVVEQKSSMSN